MTTTKSTAPSSGTFSPSPRRGKSMESGQMHAVLDVTRDMSNTSNSANGKTPSPPSTLACLRAQETACKKAKSIVFATACGTPYSGTQSPELDCGFRGVNKTLCSPQVLSAFKKRPGTAAAERVREKSQSTVFAPAIVSVPPERIRNKNNYTDPFAEDRVRDLGHKRKLLVPESTLKPTKAHGIFCGADTRLKSKTPMARDDDDDDDDNSGFLATGEPSSAVKPLSPARLASPQQVRPHKRVAEYSPKSDSKRVLVADCDDSSPTGSLFTATLLSAFPSPTRFRFSNLNTSGNACVTEHRDCGWAAEDINGPCATGIKTSPKHNIATLVGVIGAMPQPESPGSAARNRRHAAAFEMEQQVAAARDDPVESVARAARTGPNYPHKFRAPFALSGSYASYVRLPSGRRVGCAHQTGFATIHKTPYARHDTNTPGNASRTRAKGHQMRSADPLRTPFARHTSTFLCTPARSTRRAFNQVKTSPFATHTV